MRSARPSPRMEKGGRNAAGVRRRIDSERRKDITLDRIDFPVPRVRNRRVSRSEGPADPS